MSVPITEFFSLQVEITNNPTTSNIIIPHCDISHKKLQNSSLVLYVLTYYTLMLFIPQYELWDKKNGKLHT